MIEQNNSKSEKFTFTIFNFYTTSFSINLRSADIDLVRDIMREFCKKFMANNNKCFGMYKATPDERIAFDAMKITHKVTNLYVEKSMLKCDIQILDTEEGKKILNLIKNGYEMQAYIDLYNSCINLTGVGVYIPVEHNLIDLASYLFGTYADISFINKIIDKYSQYNVKNIEIKDDFRDIRWL